MEDVPDQWIGGRDEGIPITLTTVPREFYIRRSTTTSQTLAHVMHKHATTMWNRILSALVFGLRR